VEKRSEKGKENISKKDKGIRYAQGAINRY